MNKLRIFTAVIVLVCIPSLTMAAGGKKKVKAPLPDGTSVLQKIIGAHTIKCSIHGDVIQSAVIWFNGANLNAYMSSTANDYQKVNNTDGNNPSTDGSEMFENISLDPEHSDNIYVDFSDNALPPQTEHNLIFRQDDLKGLVGGVANSINEPFYYYDQGLNCTCGHSYSMTCSLMN